MSEDKHQLKGPYTATITDSTGHECLNVEMDGHDELTPQENVLWMLGHVMSESLRLVPEPKRTEIQTAAMKEMAEQEHSNNDMNIPE